MGLVEFNVGLVPGWGGTKELLRRRVNPVARVNPERVLPVLRDLLAQLMAGRVCGNAWEARSLGYLRDEDVIVMNAEHRLMRAKELARSGLPRPTETQIYAVGRVARSILDAELNERVEQGEISAYDGVIGRKLTHILCGDGDGPAWVAPQQILDTARTASLDIRFRPESRARMAHMLKTGKPLRN
jgi:3-hydroxyacyl-CoA dehydrogenase